MQVSKAQKRVLKLMNEGWALKDIHSTTVKEICLSKDGHLPRFLYHSTLMALKRRCLIEYYISDDVMEAFFEWQLTPNGKEIAGGLK